MLLIEVYPELRMIFMPYDVPSWKNSRVKTSSGVFLSKPAKRWVRRVTPLFEANTETWKSFCKYRRYFFVGLHFVRGSRRNYDWNNMTQGVADMMKDCGWIKDDHSLVFLPFPLMINGSYSSYSKENPGVFIRLLPEDAQNIPVTVKRKDIIHLKKAQNDNHRKNKRVQERSGNKSKQAGSSK